MSWATRGLGLSRELARELGMLLPRTVAGLNESTGWVPASPRGVRQFGEVMLDELVLSGFSLLGGEPRSDAAAGRVHRGGRGIVGAGHRRRARRAKTVAGDLDTATTRVRRTGIRADDVRARPDAAGDAGGRRPGRPGAGGGAPVPAPRRPEAVAGLGPRRRSGRHGGPVAVPHRPNPSRAGVQRRDAGAARPRLPAPRMAGLPGHGSAGQRRGHDARGVGGPRRGALGAAAGHRRCGVGHFDGHPGGRAGFPPREAGRRGGACTPRSWGSTR